LFNTLQRQLDPAGPKSIGLARPYERLNITGIKGLTDAQKLALKMMGAVMRGAGP